MLDLVLFHCFVIYVAHKAYIFIDNLVFIIFLYVFPSGTISHALRAMDPCDMLFFGVKFVLLFVSSGQVLG